MGYSRAMAPRSSVARLLQAVCITQLMAVAAWTAWRWPASPLQAGAGALAILLVGPAALAIELAILPRVGSAAPAPTARQLVLAWLRETSHMVRTFSWRQPFRWRQEPDFLDPACAGRTGVVLVHGFMCNRGFWNAWLRELRRRGTACIAINLEPPFGSIDAHVPVIDEAVARMAALTGHAPLLVCHSMGGLAARAWWRSTQGRRPLARLVTIGSPHGGTWLARFSRARNGRQMRLRSDWLVQLAQDERGRALPPTTCWYSNCDNVVFPAETATLPQADNRFVPGIPHVALAFEPMVMAGSLALIEQPQVPCQGDSFTRTDPEKF